MNQDGIPYTGPDRRSTPVPVERVETIEQRQRAIIQDIATMHAELVKNTEVTHRVAEILEAPATFWAWCSKWGKRVSLFAKFAAPIVAFLIALDQFLHVDIGGALRRVFFK